MLLRRESLNFLNNFLNKHDTRHREWEIGATALLIGAARKVRSRPSFSFFFATIIEETGIQKLYITKYRIVTNKGYAERSWYVSFFFFFKSSSYSLKISINYNDRSNQKSASRICVKITIQDSRIFHVRIHC